MSKPSTTDSNAPPLEVRDLQKRYKDGTRANRGITLSAESGEILGILGPNGAGKTTLVRQITTELLPTSGEMRVFGHDAVAEPSVVKSLIGVVPQEANLYYYLTVYQHLRIFGRLRGLSLRGARRRADELIEELELTEYRDKLVEKLSGGMKRRVLIGVASLARPSLLVLDEPTTGLDPRSRRGLWSLLRDYRRQGTTILMTTHYMEEAEALSDRVGIMRDGQLLALDLKADAIIRTFELLGCEVTQNDDVLTVLVPSFRPDLVREVDLIEEVGRIYDYNRIEGSTAVRGPLGLTFDSSAALQASVRLHLSGLGLDEVISGDGVTVVEWAERAEGLFGDEGLLVRLEHAGDDTRVLQLSAKTEHYSSAIDAALSVVGA